jgi:O-antigen/teichoic acid export membrane protein
MAWLENSILYYSSPNRDNYYSKIFETYSRFLFTSSILLLPLTGLIFRFMFPESYSGAIFYTPFLYLGVVFFGYMQFYENGFLSAKYTRMLFYGMFGCGIFNFLANYFLISYWGLQGASITFFLTYLFLWLFLKWKSVKIYRIHFPVKVFLVLLSFFILMAFPILLGITNLWIECILFLIAISLFVVFNKELIINSTNRIKALYITFNRR